MGYLSSGDKKKFIDRLNKHYSNLRSTSRLRNAVANKFLKGKLDKAKERIEWKRIIKESGTDEKLLKLFGNKGLGLGYYELKKIKKIKEEALKKEGLTDDQRKKLIKDDRIRALEQEARKEKLRKKMEFKESLRNKGGEGQSMADKLTSGRGMTRDKGSRGAAAAERMINGSNKQGSAEEYGYSHTGGDHHSVSAGQKLSSDKSKQNINNAIGGSAKQNINSITKKNNAASIGGGIGMRKSSPPTGGRPSIPLGG